MRDISELLAERGPQAERHPLALSVAFQDSCHLLHAQGVRSAPRAVLSAIPGLDLREPADQEICCGSAGIYNLVQPEAAAELGAAKAQAVLATGASAYASANPGCLIQVTTHLRAAGSALCPRSTRSSSSTRRSAVSTPPRVLRPRPNLKLE